MRKVPAHGPRNATIAIVGEAPGFDEEQAGVPFIGASGRLLTALLTEAGISRSDCFITNVCKYRPQNNDVANWFTGKEEHRGLFPAPEMREGLNELEKELAEVSPNIVIALGNVSLWALTSGCVKFKKTNGIKLPTGVGTWRGSLIRGRWGLKVLPSYHPAAVMRQWVWRPILTQDLRRAASEAGTSEIEVPPYNFIVRPSFEAALNWLKEKGREAGESSSIAPKSGQSEGGQCAGSGAKALGPPRGLQQQGAFPLSVDIETRSGHIACIGLSTSTLDAICIPLMCVEKPGGYWSLEEETQIVLALRALLTHPNVTIIGQNFSYDAQYIAHWWFFLPVVSFDTMIAQNVCYPGMQKGLDYLASMYCEYYAYWKAESKEWDPKMGEDQLWVYNCKDCVYTFEIAFVLQRVAEHLGVTEPLEFQMSLFEPVLRMMLRGVKVDTKRRTQMAREVTEAIKERNEWLTTVLGHPLNPNSAPQMRKLFYVDLNLRPVISPKTKKVTLDNDALDLVALRDVIIAPICKTIQELRSLRILLSTFLSAPLSLDKRMRCYFNIAGTETFRFSSSKDAFGRGGNLQNLPSGGEME